MRIVLVILLGSVTASPYSCGQADKKPPASSSASKQKQAVPKSAAQQKGKQPQPRDDALVPPIDLGDYVGRFGKHELSAIQYSYLDFTSDPRAEFHAHGEKVCASGCAASRHPTGVLSKAKYLWLLRRFAEQPMDETSPALEELMYYGRQTQMWMHKLGTGSLDEERTKLLRAELPRTHAMISFRIIDEYGEVRVYMPPTRVPLDRRHEFRMETKNLPPLITSGTVKRVGRYHLWTRL